MKSSGFPLYLLLSLFFGSVLFADFIPSIMGAYADQRLLLSISLVILMTFTLAWLSLKSAVTVSFTGLWPFFLFLFSFALAALRCDSQPFCLIEPIFFALYFLAIGLVGGTLREANLVREAAQAAILVAAITCFFYAAMTINVYLFAIADDFSHLDHVIPWGFVNIRYWSHIATWLVPLIPLGTLFSPWKDSRLWQLGLAFTAAIWWWIIFLSSSRGSMVGLLVGFLLVAICFRRAALPWIKLFVRFALYGLLVWLVLSVLIPSLVFDDLRIRGITATSSGRMPLWHEAWAMSLQNFPFGMGPQSWLTHDILTNTYRSSLKFGHPHNMYLMWAAEYGWISIAGLLIVGSYALRRVWLRASVIRKGYDPEGLWLCGFTASVTAALVHAGVSAVFIAPGSMLVGLVVLIIFWGLIRPGREGRNIKAGCDVGRQSYSKIMGYLIAVIFMISGGFWFREVVWYQKAMADDLEYYQTELSLRHLPRFWFHGNFPRNPSQMQQEQPFPN